MTTASKIRKNITRTNLKKEYGKIHDRVINVSEETVDVTVENIEKWQKLFAKSLEASTPLVEKGIDMSFEVVETLWKQYRSGGKRVKSLLGLDKNMRRSNKAVSKPLSKSVKKENKMSTAKAVSEKVPSKLTDVNGIGPKISSLLKESGVQSIADLANADIKTVQNVLDAAGSRYQMHDPSTWINQAKAIIKA